MDLQELIAKGVILIKCPCGGKVFFGKVDEVEEDYHFECPECNVVIAVSRKSLEKNGGKHR
jgi:DNA-directed RNA polymerase subunit RPC12/RpoP